MQSMDQLYKDDAVVRSKILEARGFFSTKTTEEEWNMVIENLMLMVLYCNENMIPSVKATLCEAQTRYAYFRFGILSIPQL